MTVDDVRGVVNDVDALLLSAKGIFNSLGTHFTSRGSLLNLTL